MEGTIIFLFLYQVILPSGLIFLLWKGVFKTYREWLGLLIFSALYISWIFFSGRWDWLGYYIRYIWVILFLISIYKSNKKVEKLPFKGAPSFKGKIKTTFFIIIAIIFLSRNLAILSSITVNDDEALNLSFPLKNGTYYIGHGGSSTEMNYHHTYEPQQYALDILQLNNLGMRAKGLYPDNLKNYVIFETPVYSPCNADILESENDLANLTPGDVNPDRPLGNFVSLQCEGSEATIYMAHMLKGSVNVTAGNTITVGDVIGAVGNSGNTSEPHLHIHAEKNDIGIPMTFEGEYPVRNSLIKD